ncbi:MAG: hypothetical protein IPM23_06330 [Candidatus Melainabacteria bacterium]|nr:hypothetical protein [Candidatus Melainabacteria bacterium]
MRKHKYVLAALALCVIPQTPVLAADSEPAIEAAVKFPMRLTALATGLAFGIPVSTMKEVPENIVSVINDTWSKDEGTVAGALANSLVLMPATVIGGAMGVARGIEKGTVNAFENFYHRPFSPESFSVQLN